MPRLFKQFRYPLLSFVVLLLASSWASAQDETQNLEPAANVQISSEDNTPAAEESDEELEDIFLPVDEAFQATPRFDGGKLYLDWSIANDYYLYKEKFRIRAIGAGKSQIIQPIFEQGQLKFDKYFNKEVEIFRLQTRIELPFEGLPSPFILKVRSQGCAEAGLCYAPRVQFFKVDTSVQNVVTIGKSRNSSSSESASDIENEASPALVDVRLEEEKPLWLYILLALGGGFILNFMPCVFPILSLKAMSFAGKSRGLARQSIRGWSYSLGVIGSFLIIGIVLSALRSAGESADWGFQLQSPIFVAMITYLFLVMGLSLSGMIHFGAGISFVGNGVSNSRGVAQSFSTGILAVIIASPCTGPMMAPAIGFALTQPLSINILVFSALGLGMSLPFLALSYSPTLARILPKPGAWMETFRQFLAFPMYISAAWLLFVFSNQVGTSGAFYLVLGGIALAFALWLNQNTPKSKLGGWSTRALAIACICFALIIGLRSEKIGDNQSFAQAYSKERVEKIRRAGRPVFVDVTADWCITCKANELNALSRREFKEAMKQYGYVLLKGDYTNEDPRITQVLREFNRVGVPLYLVYPADPNKPVEVLPQILTKEIVLDALHRNAR